MAAAATIAVAGSSRASGGTDGLCHSFKSVGSLIHETREKEKRGLLRAASASGAAAARCKPYRTLQIRQQSQFDPRIPPHSYPGGLGGSRQHAGRAKLRCGPGCGPAGLGRPEPREGAATTRTRLQATCRGPQGEQCGRLCRRHPAEPSACPRNHYPPCPAPTRQVVITGSTRGLGLALARKFLSLGDDVVVSSRSAEAVEAAAAKLRAAFPGCRVVAVVADVSKPADVDRLVSRAVEELGQIVSWIWERGRGAGGGERWSARHLPARCPGL